jgi:hypothetical protein
MMAPTCWSLPTDLVSASVEIMRSNGRRGHEGLALWFGRRNEVGKVSITHLVSVTGPGFVSAPLQLRLSWRAMSRLTDLADSLQLYMVGQIHSHPGTMVDLSPVDKELGIRCQDYLSAVCPFYAQKATDDIRGCGVHVFDGGAYRRLSLTEIARRTNVVGMGVEKIQLEVPA